MAVLTFETFLRECVAKNADARLRAHERDGVIRFYAHPYSVDGSTVDFSVSENRLTQLSTHPVPDGDELPGSGESASAVSSPSGEAHGPVEFPGTHDAEPGADQPQEAA